MGLLDGKVVLITGAGGGIGRAHALACAREGARIVVNDLGVQRDGQGGGEPMADAVVKEIEALGGQAVANHDSVTDAEGCARMVAAATDTWGRLDAVVNNAGILRDKTFAKLSEDEWKLVIDVHLTGTKNVTRAALDALIDGGGAIINTSSYSGLIGNFGQSNYAAAKAGIYGLTQVLALELRKHGVTANCVAPVAKTRMTDDVPLVQDEWTAEQIAPVVVFLASDLAKGVTGRVFGVQGQRLHAYEMQTNEGVEKPGTDLWTAQEIRDQLGAILSFDKAVAAPPGDDLVSKVFSHFPAAFIAKNAKGWAATIHWRVKGGGDQTLRIRDGVASVVAGLEGDPTCTVKVPRDVLVDMFTGKLDAKQAFMTGKANVDNIDDLVKMAMSFDFPGIAKAMGAGAPEAQVEPADKVIPLGKRYDGGYRLVDRAEFQAYAAATDDANDAWADYAPPMYHVRCIIDLMMKMAQDPELQLDILRLVHAEHDMRFHQVLRHGQVLQLRGTLQGFEEKSSGQLASFGIVGFVDGKPAIEGTTSYFIRAKSPPAGKKAAGPAEPPPAPDASVQQIVTLDQADRYAVASGDHNPIHVDPATAKAAGLPGVILHGLCTMAFAGRDVVNTLADGDPSRLKRLAVRFARPVFPGQTLTLKLWGTGSDIQFQTENEQGQAVIVNGRAEVI